MRLPQADARPPKAQAADANTSLLAPEAPALAPDVLQKK